MEPLKINQLTSQTRGSEAPDIQQLGIHGQEVDAVMAALNRVQAVITFDLTGKILAANDNFLAAMGYTLAEVQGKQHKIFVDPEYALSLEYRLFWERLARGEYVAGEFKRRGKDGREVWINASYNPIRDESGNVVKVIKFATDITAEKLLAAEAQGKVEAINKSQAVIEFNVDGTIIEANENFLSAMGYTSNEVKGKHHRIFVDPSYAATAEYKEFWHKLGRGEFDSGEYKRVGKGGKEVWIQASYNPILDMNGKVFKIVKFATDITDRKLRNAEYEGKVKAVDKSQAAIEFAVDGTILNANENFLNAMGYTAEEIKGKHHRMFVDPKYAASSEYQEFWKKLGRGEYDSNRYKRVGKNGKEVWIQASYNPIFDMNGKVMKIVKYATDITMQVEIEQTVQKMSANFMQTSKGISDSASTLASGAQSLGATTEEMNASIEELTASINSIAQNAKGTDGLAKSTQLDAETGAKSISKAIEAMELISKSSEDISEIVKVISEIASQTNLLAFNAAIEAARAGEHGLGFSVVADEVRKLAERSSQATKDISKLISESVKRINQGSEVSKLAGEAFTKIVSGVGKTTQSISEISVAAEEQLVAAREVSSAVHQVALETEKSAYATEQIADACKGLMEGSEQLNKTIARFSAR